MYVVYLITNTVNNKSYVGYSSKSAEHRWQYHCWSKNKKDYFHYAIQKYGKSSFVVQTLAKVSTRAEAKNLERIWIVLLRSAEKMLGYNSTYGGEEGENPTAETRAKIGAASRGRVHNAETRAKMSAAHSGQNNHFFGRKHTPEVVETMKAKLRIKLGGENNPWFGKKLSAEHRLKISLAKRKYGTKPADKSEFELCESTTIQ